jgi:hypothetical protein
MKKHYLHTNDNGLLRLRPAVLRGRMTMPQYAGTRQRVIAVMRTWPFRYYAGWMTFDEEGRCDGRFTVHIWQPSREDLNKLISDTRPKIRFAKRETCCPCCGKEYVRPLAAKPQPLALVRADGNGVH